MRQNLEILLAELESNYLEVGLAPAPRPAHCGHMVRVAFSHNATWYRNLCRRYSSARNSKDTSVRRQDILRVLQRLITQGHSRSKYAQDLLRLAA